LKAIFVVIRFNSSLLLFRNPLEKRLLLFWAQKLQFSFQSTKRSRMYITQSWEGKYK
jgi:hypothetical protein